MNYKFSVLMSVYYKEKSAFLKESLDSILNQTLLPNEIVIVKDGPLTKELDDIIYKYTEKYGHLFRVLALDKNVGLGKALAYGVEFCHYPIIARMDSDDISVSNRFEIQMLEFKSNPEISLVGSNVYEFVDSTSNIIGRKKVPLKFEEIIKYSKNRNPFNHMSVMFKKEDVINIGNYKASKYTEDYYLWVRMIKAGYRMKNVSQYLVYARTGDDMFKRRGGVDYLKNEILLQIRFLKLKHTNIFEFFFNILTKSLVRLLPNSIRKLVYIKLLRN